MIKKKLIGLFISVGFSISAMFAQPVQENYQNDYEGQGQQIVYTERQQQLMIPPEHIRLR